MIPIFAIFFFGVLFLAVSSLRIAREYERGVIFRLGRYVGLRGPGLYIMIPSDFASLAKTLNDFMKLHSGKS